MAGKKGQKINKETSLRFPNYWQNIHPEWTFEQCQEKANWQKKSSNYQCIEYYERKYPELSHEEHLKLKQRAIIERRKNKITNIEYWKEKYPEKSLDELEILRSNAAKERNKINIEYWIKKYPEKTYEEQNKLYNEYKKKWLEKNKNYTFKTGDKNCNSKKNTDQKTRNSRSPRNIEFYERKYPELSHEEHLKLQQNFFNKNKIAVKNAIKPTNIEYYLNLGMSEIDAKQALYNRQSTFTLEKCIKKYGELEGLKKFSERQQKWLKSLKNNFNINGDGRSVQSQFAKNIIKICCKNLNIKIPKKEKYIYNKKLNCAYAFDFTYNNKVIEFQGDYWHCNPKLYDKDFYNKVKQQTAQEIWNYDKIKKECAEYYGYKVLYIWEYDYNKNPEEIVNKCIEFLNS